MNVFVTSDLHFFHTNILKFNPEARGHFRDVNAMNEGIVANWNKKVTTEDYVYILGDVAFANPTLAVSMVGRLNGRLHLVKGNHDKKLLENETFRKMFVGIYDYKELNFLDSKVCMFHYPIWEWNQMHRGALMLHGHVHGNKVGVPGRIKDVGIDTAPDFAPYNLHDVYDELVKQPIRGHNNAKD